MYDTLSPHDAGGKFVPDMEEDKLCLCQGGLVFPQSSVWIWMKRQILGRGTCSAECQWFSCWVASCRLVVISSCCLSTNTHRRSHVSGNQHNNRLLRSCPESPGFLRQG